MSNQKIDDLLKDLDINIENDEDNETEISVSAAFAQRKVKKPLAERLLTTLVPMRSDSRPEMIRKIVFIVSAITAIVCLILILKASLDNGTSQKRDEELRQIREEIVLTGDIPLDNETIERVKEEVPGILDEYILFYNENPDLIGWVRIPGTIIDYPVVQNDDNSYYLEHSFDGTKSKNGTIFADYNVKFTPTKRPNNTVLYGHNIIDGSYFAAVTNYYPNKYGSLNYYINHPLVEFDTIYEKGVYKVFAGMYINTQADDNGGYVYEYYKKRTFKNKESFYDFAQNIMDRSVFYTDVDIEYGDEFLTLSTCHYPLGNNVDTRFVLFARRVREGENAEVDTSKAEINPSPLYFERYYRVMGSSWAGRNWNLSLVNGLREYLEENPDKSTIN